MKFKHYGEPPWIFKGRALFQLQLVPVEEANKYIPPDFSLVSLFGHTLGGFYLARYDDSPVGAFVELVAMAGIVWNFPTSSAWAARVYVSNREARDHGVWRVGLPSRYVQFNAKKHDRHASTNEKARAASWWDQPFQDSHARPALQLASVSEAGHVGSGSEASGHLPQEVTVQLQEQGSSWVKGGQQSTVCHIPIPDAIRGWKGPRIPITLPSFSGNTPQSPALLSYACQLITNVRMVAPVSLRLPQANKEDNHHEECLSGILRGKPLLCMAFNNMEMVVEEPEQWLPKKEVR